MSLKCVLFAFIIALYAYGVNAIQFTLRPSEETCISKEVIRKEYLSGTFEVRPERSRIGVYVRGPSGQVVYEKRSINDGKFAFTSDESGEYKACFSNAVEPGAKTIKLVMLTGVEAKPTGAAKKKNLKPLELQIRHIEEVVTGIVNDEEWITERQEKMREVNDSTSSYVFWFNVTTIIIAVASYFIQLWYLKNYFRSKKLVID